MAGQESSTHLLSLKVMRISRPELGSFWQPFYSSSPSFSAHSTASILSLQGNKPLSGHPKTLRDLTHASELLMLPPAFGSIQLGETFSCCLCLNNEVNTPIGAVSMKVEIQTTTSKVLLAEIGGTDRVIAPLETLQCFVMHEIKELGQHVLGCHVTYQVPSSALNAPTHSALASFRKFYKFAVTNPLSVKTKVHLPRSPSALLSLTERDKIFLEIHIQNLTQNPIQFESMGFEAAENWNLDTSHSQEPMTLMQPQDIRQYLYILIPTHINPLPPAHPPGTVMPLGRLDLAWRSPFGEPGRLLTSMLSRRIPLQPAPTQPPSALPPHLRRNNAHVPTPSRPQSPITNSRPGTPKVDYPVRKNTSVDSARPPTPPPPDIELTLLVRHVPYEAIRVHLIFKIAATLIITAPSSLFGDGLKTLTFVIQHIFAQRPKPPLATSESLDPRPTSGFSTPSSASTNTFNYLLAHQKLLSSSPRKPQEDTAPEVNLELGQWTLPVPHHRLNDTKNDTKNDDPTTDFIGPSAFSFSLDSSLAGAVFEESSSTPRSNLNYDFELNFVPKKKGYNNIGGIRILMIQDVGDLHATRQQTVHILKEWDTLGAVWASA